MAQSGRTMRVALNLLEFNPGGMGGVETYVRELVAGLSLPDSGCELTLVCNERAGEYFATLAPHVGQLVFETRRGSSARCMRSVLRVVGIDLVKLAVDRLQFDLVHTPFTNVRMFRFKAPQVVTFLDLQHEYFPAFFTQRELKRRDMKFRLAARLATQIIAISRFTKDCLVDRYKVKPDRIDVVHLASNAEYRPRTDQQQLAETRQRYGLHRPFLYYPAATWPHKNHAALLAALKILVEYRGFDGELVLTGIASRNHDTIRAAITSMGLVDRVRILGYLPYQDLPCLYNLARMLVFPSLHEGFGIPVVEAMASGCPVICANTTSLPEVAGDAALLFDAAEPDAIADAVMSVWSNETLRNRLIARGLERANEFSWGKMVEETRRIYGIGCIPANVRTTIMREQPLR